MEYALSPGECVSNRSGVGANMAKRSSLTPWRPAGASWRGEGPRLAPHWPVAAEPSQPGPAPSGPCRSPPPELHGEGDRKTSMLPVQVPCIQSTLCMRPDPSVCMFTYVLTSSCNSFCGNTNVLLVVFLMAFKFESERETDK